MDHNIGRLKNWFKSASNKTSAAFENLNLIQYNLSKSQKTFGVEDDK